MKTQRLAFIILLLSVSKMYAQFDEAPFRMFGYFQISFMQQLIKDESDKKSFDMQQFNLFLQRDLTENWSTFINFEYLNNFSSGKSWGDFSLNEVWVKYYLSKRFNLKLGLQIPPFNNLNEISNKTPLLPYIIRPLAYETSFNEFLNLEDFTPQRAFAQIYGFIPIEDTKLDYAFYVGNSPNISTKETSTGQSGVDTTNLFLVGGRIGLRYEDIKIGFSASYDEITKFNQLKTYFGLPEYDFNNIPRFRIGHDILLDFKKVSFQAEYIKVLYNTNNLLDLDKQFFYVTMGYRITDDLLAYFSLYSLQEHFNVNIPNFAHLNTEVSVTTPNVGLAYDINDRIKIKGQFARVDIDVTNYPEHESLIFYYAAAISVFF
ncbi:MAG: hypothetical protein V1773_10105 [bacterium]